MRALEIPNPSPLTWPVAAPLLGWGGRPPRAGFDTAVALVGRPHADSFTGDRGSQPPPPRWSRVSPVPDVDLHRQDAKDLLQALYAPSSAGVYFGPGSTGGGGSLGSPFLRLCNRWFQPASYRGVPTCNRRGR